MLAVFFHDFIKKNAWLCQPGILFYVVRQAAGNLLLLRLLGFSLSCLTTDHSQNEINGSIDSIACAVDTQVVVIRIAPASSGIEIVIMRVFFVKLFQEMTRFFPVETGIYLARWILCSIGAVM